MLFAQSIFLMENLLINTQTLSLLIHQVKLQKHQKEKHHIVAKMTVPLRNKRPVQGR